ncbi:MAG: UvrD-helicase domain-containing protein, partial [Burkholderiaceae bacterium]
MFPEVQAHEPPMVASLNPEQRAAVTLPDEHALILAGAGSGKTRVLTTRIAWLLQEGRVSPGGVLAVTFTNKAAKEMMTRLSAMLPVNVRGMWIGTFHGLCNRFLRAHYKIANLPSTFQILDTQDQLSAIKRLMKQHNVDEERFPAKQTQWFIAGCKEDGLRPNAVEAPDADTRRKVEIYQLYEEQCQREGVVDFGELMLRSYELLRDNDPIREHYQRRFRHILVDEFQDTNKLQYAWLKQLAGPQSSVLAVGDDDQSIYAFRGARVGNMADFVREFAVKHQIKLEQNYRSYSNILDSANALISHNKTRLGKNLRTDRGPGEPVRVYESPTDIAEAQWMVEEMRHLVRGDGTQEAFERKEIAVLYRSNAQSRVIETALFNAGVPYRVYGGLRFFERAEIKHALAYLRLLENPGDETSFLRVVNFPARGIGARSIEQLQDAARASGSSLWAAASSVTGKAGASIGAFTALVEEMRRKTEGLTLREIIEVVVESSGLIEHYRAEREGADRIENLDELVNAAESFVTQEGFGRDAVALPVDDFGPLRQSPVSQGLDPGRPLETPAEAQDGLPAPDYVPPDAETGETIS